MQFAEQVDQRVRQTLAGDDELVRKFTDAAGDLAVNLVVAAVILAVTLWTAGWLSSLVKRALGRVLEVGSRGSAPAMMPCASASDAPGQVRALGSPSAEARTGPASVTLIAVTVALLEGESGEDGDAATPA